jgi:hypothetical protein
VIIGVRYKCHEVSRTAVHLDGGRACEGGEAIVSGVLIYHLMVSLEDGR